MKIKKYMKAAVVYFAAIAIVWGIRGIPALAKTEEAVICKGVFIDSVDVSGLSPEKAQKKVDQYIQKMTERSLEVKIDDKLAKIPLKDLGFQCKPNNYMEQAMLVGKSGNFIKRYKELKDIEEKKLVYKLHFSVNDQAIQEFVKEKCTKYDVKSKNAGLARKKGEFTIIPEKIGRKVVVNETVDKIKSSIDEKRTDSVVTLDAVIIDAVPKYKTEDVEKCNTVLGEFKTNYSSSSNSRAENLANGARLMNGTVVYPQEVFSAYQYLSPYTKENGYFEAGSYANGMLVDSLGGGVCQVTTTLYNALLRSEVEIVERYPHSMSVAYVDLSMDAAVAGTTKDLKFKNNTEVPLYVEAIAKDRTITFRIWGQETRDTANRKIEFESKLVATIAPPDEVKKVDPDKPPTYYEVTQSAHTGYRAELYKKVYIGGKLTDTIQVNSSTYNASPRYVTVGAEVEKPEPDETEKPEDTEEPKDTEKPKDTETPKKEEPKDIETPKKEEPKDTETPKKEEPKQEVKKEPRKEPEKEPEPELEPDEIVQESVVAEETEEETEEEIPDSVDETEE